MSRLIRVFITALLFVAALATGREPAWILLERGKAAFDERNLTASLDLFLDAVEGANEFPEAEYWLGLVYAFQGQNVLAEQQYRRAMALSLYLRVPEERYEIAYSLADLLLNSGEGRRSEALIVLSGIADSEGASSPGDIDLEHRYVHVLIERGLDELLFLYRDELGHSLKARRLMGELAWNTGRYRSALVHSVRTVLAMLSTASELYRAENPSWRFDIDVPEDERKPDRDVRYPGDNDGTVSLLYLLQNRRSEVFEWLDEYGFWAQLYLLSVSLYAEGFSERAVSLWSLMAPPDPVTGDPSPLRAAGRWGVLASAQLDEPLITTGSLVP